MAIGNKILPTFVVLLIAAVIIVPFCVHTKKPTEHSGPGSLFVVKIGPSSSAKHPFVRRDPYSIRIPLPAVLYGPHETFKDMVLDMHQYVNTAIDHARWPESDPSGICIEQRNGTMQYTAEELGTVASRIRNGFRLNYYIDDMPIVSQYGSDGEYRYGVDIGFLSENEKDVFLFTHYDIHIAVDAYGRTLHAVIVPRHTDSAAACGVEYAQPTRAASDVVWTYRVFVERTNTKFEDRMDFYNEKLHGQHAKIEKAALIYCGVAAGIVLLLLGFLVWRIAHRKYELEGLLLTSAATMAGTSLQAVGSSSSDSYIDIELDLADDKRGLLHDEEAGSSRRRQAPKATIYVDVDVNSTGPSTQSFLKSAAPVILGQPKRPVLLAALTGTGVHLLTVTLLGLALSSLVQHSWNNAWQTVIVLLMPVTGCVGGFAATRIIRLYRAKNVLCAGLLLVVMMPAVLLFIFFLVNSIELMHHKWSLVASLFFFCGALLVADCVSMFGGMWLASKFAAPSLPESTGRIYLPPIESKCKWITQFILTTTVSSGLIGFGVIYVTLKIVQSIWADRVVVMILAILGFILLWVLITAAVSILIAYFRVVWNRDPYWHWKTFMTAGGPAVVAFIFGLFYAFTTLDEIDFGTQLLIYLIITFASAMMFIVLGSVAVISTDTFFRRYVYYFVTIRA